MNNVIQPLVEGKPLNKEFGPEIVLEPKAIAQTVMGTAGSRSQSRTAYAASPLGEDNGLSGSNAFAVAPSKSAANGNGPTILVSNTHQPLTGPVAWYELVVESEEGWHFAGANFPGVPYPVMGHNETLGWTFTVNRPDLVDVYKLEIEEAARGDDEPVRYRLDGEWLDLETTEVTLPVRVGPVVLPIRRTVYRSAHGPVIANDDGFFAFRYAGMGNVGMVDAFYRKTKATTFAEWQSVMARMDIPSFNTIFADATGNIAYIYNAAIPDRRPGADWRTVLPGDDSTLIWKGPVNYERLPRYVNPASGWLMNANNAPFRAAGPGSDLSPDDFDPLLGVELKSTNRARRAWALMSETDVLDNDALQRIKYDTSYVREGYVGELLDDVAALDLAPDSDLARAQALLASWDMTADNIGAGDALTLLLIRDFMSAEYQNKPLPDAREALAQATSHLLTHFGRIDPPMSELLRLRKGDTDLPLDGGSDTLRASTTWDVHEDGRLSVRHGDSFIMWMNWTPGERVSSRSIQPYGAATNRPGSRHYTDQSTLFVQHRLKPVHFWREDVIANARSRKRVASPRAAERTAP